MSDLSTVVIENGNDRNRRTVKRPGTATDRQQLTGVGIELKPVATSCRLQPTVNGSWKRHPLSHHGGVVPGEFRNRGLNGNHKPTRVTEFASGQAPDVTVLRLNVLPNGNDKGSISVLLCRESGNRKNKSIDVFEVFAAQLDINLTADLTGKRRHRLQQRCGLDRGTQGAECNRLAETTRNETAPRHLSSPAQINDLNWLLFEFQKTSRNARTRHGPRIYGKATAAGQLTAASTRQETVTEKPEILTTMALAFGLIREQASAATIDRSLGKFAPDTSNGATTDAVGADAPR